MECPTPITELPKLLPETSIVFCDVDNVLAPAAWRFQYIDHETKDVVKRWDNFHKASIIDRPNFAMVEWVKQTKRNGIDVLFLTAMSERYRTIREWWLENVCGLDRPNLLMREADDFGPAAEVKERVIREAMMLGDLEVRFPNSHITIIDDRTDILLHAAATLKVSTRFYAIEKEEKVNEHP